MQKMKMKVFKCISVRTESDADIKIALSSYVETVVCLSNKNAKPQDYVEIGVDAEDYYRIKDS
jgi:hypothetical protein